MSKRATPSGYVLYCHERLRDGREEWAECFDTIGKVEVYMNNILAGGPVGGNTSFRLFELGKEIPLREEATEVPQPAKRTTRMVVGDAT